MVQGGVAVFFDSSKITLKKFPLNALQGNEVRNFKILAVKGNIRGIKRELVSVRATCCPK